MLYKKNFLKNFTKLQEKTCVRLSFLIKLQVKGLQKETLTQVFSCEFYEIFKNTYFTVHHRTNGSTLNQNAMITLSRVHIIHIYGIHKHLCVFGIILPKLYNNTL